MYVARAGSPREKVALNTLTLLVVDDDVLAGRLLKANLDRPGRIECEVLSSARTALERMGRRPFDAVLTDLQMPEMDGIELVRRIRATDTALPIIVLTAHGTLENAVEAIRAGATEFLPKPVNVSALMTLLERAIADRPVREEVAARRARRADGAAEAYIYGSHPRLDAVRQFAQKIAGAVDTRVLITGESGTGKSRLARAIHELSGVSGRLVEVNCAALPPQLIESELFGHEKGAFTDAKSLKRGRIELANKGTLFLDEIGALPVEVQAKLLLFLENREIWRVGGTDPIPVRARVISATNEDLRQRVRDRTFREDLLYRLDVVSTEMPALRQMPSVIPELAERFVRQMSSDRGHPPPQLTEHTFAALPSYPWPGNVRELRNAVERALIFSDEDALVVLPPAYEVVAATRHRKVCLEYGLTLEEVERRYLSSTLEESPGELSEVAAQLGISRKTLWEKRKRYGL